MAPHSSTLAWKIPWMGESGRLQSMGSLRVGHDWATSLSLFTFMHWRRKCKPLQCSCLENPRGGGAWWAAIYGVAQSRTRLKWLSSSSSMPYYLFNSWVPTSFTLIIKGSGQQMGIDFKQRRIAQSGSFKSGSTDVVLELRQASWTIRWRCILTMVDW